MNEQKKYHLRHTVRYPIGADDEDSSDSEGQKGAMEGPEDRPTPDRKEKIEEALHESLVEANDDTDDHQSAVIIEGIARPKVIPVVPRAESLTRSTLSTFQNLK